jgi:membrane-associated protein
MIVESFVELASGSPWTYAVILGIAALDAVLPLVPSETTVISAGVLAGAGDLQLGLVIAAGAAGAYGGDSGAYWLGRRADERLARRLFRGAKGARRRAWAARTLHRHGGPLIFGARFVPGGRTATTVTAGLLRMRWARFALFAGAAGIVWASYAALVGYLGGRAFEDNPLWGLLLGFGVAAVTFLVVDAVRRMRRSAARGSLRAGGTAPLERASERIPRCQREQEDGAEGVARPEGPAAGDRVDGASLQPLAGGRDRTSLPELDAGHREARRECAGGLLRLSPSHRPCLVRGRE